LLQGFFTTNMVKKHLKSYKHAREGFLELLTVKNHNFIVEIIFTGVILLISFLLNIPKAEWLIVVLCCGVVLITEIINTSIEAACNAIDLNHNPQIKIAKDIAAAAVVMSGITSLIIGLAIFLPKIILLLSN